MKQTFWNRFRSRLRFGVEQDIPRVVTSHGDRNPCLKNETLRPAQGRPWGTPAKQVEGRVRQASRLRRGLRRGLRLTWVQASEDKRELARHAPQGQLLPPRPVSRSAVRAVRRVVLPQLPELIQVILDRAMQGDMDAAKLLWKMAEFDKVKQPGAKRPGKNFVQKAMAEFRARH